MAQYQNQAQLSYRTVTVNSNTAIGEILEPLSVAKTASPDTYTAGQSVTYAVSLVNAGPSTLSGLTLRDDLGAYTVGTEVFVPLSYEPDSVRLFVGGVLQSAPTVEAGPPLVISGLSLPAGQDLVLLYRASLTPFAPPAPESVITNTATVSGIASAVTAQATISALAEPLLSVQKSIEPIPVAEGGEVTYTFLIRNEGGGATVDDDAVTLSDLFDPILTGVSASLDGTPLVLGTDYTYDPQTGLFATLPGRIALPAAAFERDAQTGAWTVVPSSVTLTVTGRIS